ncbi:MAG TPA: endonuclease/exonuclease/phosphatase family protein [Burkholderiales bacterium]|nr:endonuclease/exonuclease/phosphatase family protein [Burkholderiales bacterium]
MSAVLRIVTLNIHKGLSQFNRRVVIHELREGLRSLAPDLVFLQEVQGLNERHALRFAAWPGEPQHEFLAGGDWASAYGRNRVHQYGHYGNAVLSRYPIVSSETEDISDHRFERRGLLHCVLHVPGWPRNLHCVCVHLSLHERGRRRQLDAIAARLGQLAQADAPIIVAGDFNDWRQRASAVLERSLGMLDVTAAAGGARWRTFPSMLPLLRLDRIYARGFRVASAQVHRGAPWSLLSDHLALSAELERVPERRRA